MDYMVNYYDENRWRSLAKALSYRIMVLILDFSAIYLLTGKTDIAFWFMFVSNIYTTLAYYVHERIWNRLAWGKQTSK